MILHSIQEDNRQYSEDHTEMDDLLEELQQPFDQTPLECEDAEILPAPTDTPDHPMLIQQSKADERIEPEEQDSTMIVSSTFFPPEETSSATETDSPPEAKNRDAAPKQDAKAGLEIVDQPLSSEHLIGRNTGFDLTAAHEKNPDFVAWLKIPGTNVNYPVVLSDDTDYYLTHSFTGKQSKLGTLFSLKKTDYETPGRNIAIYGHHITNTSSGELMFRPLLSYKNQSFYEKHSMIYLDSLYHTGIYKVFAVVNLVKGEWDPSTASFASDADFLAFIRQAQARSLYDTGVEVTAADRILTLITCDRSYAAADGRLIVLAVEQ